MGLILNRITSKQEHNNHYTNTSKVRHEIKIHRLEVDIAIQSLKDRKSSVRWNNQRATEIWRRRNNSRDHKIDPKIT